VGQYHNASATLEAGIRKYPRQAEFYYQYALAIIHHDDSGSSQTRAEALLRKALALNDSIAGAHYELGNILLAQDQPDRALEELQKAAKLDPSNADTHYALWLDFRKLGRVQQAADELQMFKKLKPEGSDAPH
jgi:tetratricopeptide (TPR) repeat protein